MVMWDEVINEIALEFPDVTLDHMLGKFVLPPRSLRRHFHTSSWLL